MTAPGIVLMGNLLVDDLVFPDGRTHMGQPGGAVLHASLAAALWGVTPGIVSLRGDDYPGDMLATLAARGVALEGVHPLGGPGGRAWLLYEDGVRQIVHRLRRPSHEALSPRLAHVPDAWRAAPAFHLGPMPFEIQRELAQSLSAQGAFVSLDPHRPITEDSLAAWREVIAHVDVFLPSEDELRLADALADPQAALRRLAHGRVRFIVFKRGIHGGVVYDAHEDRCTAWTARDAGVADPTGAGDAFAMGFVTARLHGLDLAASLHRARVTASIAISDWGATPLTRATRAEAEARLAAWTASEPLVP